MKPASRQRCEMCKSVFLLSSQEKRLILTGEPVFDTPKCLLKYITGEKHNFLSEGVVPKPSKMSNAGEDLRSGHEVAMRSWLEIHSIPFEYEPFAIRLQNGDRYVPDFFLRSFNAMLECKGMWGIGAKEKLRRVLSEGNNVIVVPDYLIRKIKSEVARLRR